MAKSPPLTRTLGFFAALLLALCAGAVWSVVALFTGSGAAWMALPAGIVSGIGIATVGTHDAATRALIAGLLTLTSAAYAYFLNAATVISMTLGIPFQSALADIGAEMAWAMTVARLSAVSAALVAVGALLAALTAWLRTTKDRREK